MDKLNILWTTTNEDTITNMIAMYSINTLKKGLWNEVNIIVWGGSAKLLGEDQEVQAEVLGMIKGGVSVQACQACCEKYGVSESLRNLGIDVRFMGEPLTTIIKNGENLLTL
ncbi:DsrE family protein [Labilibaculum filiforme]|uniref:DsrE family protein n=1 Tax=Labilibaculum filiforme TaxID=1940526 RepID=A0A2N3I699_9BACT|nr:DsrE family protein [Labilibaculum filiforme]PKQ65821.1 DsrE family protein [Labilibaculum filiforme]